MCVRERKKREIERLTRMVHMRTFVRWAKGTSPCFSSSITTNPRRRKVRALTDIQLIIRFGVQVSTRCYAFIEHKVSCGCFHIIYNKRDVFPFETRRFSHSDSHISDRIVTSVFFGILHRSDRIRRTINKFTQKEATDFFGVFEYKNCSALLPSVSPSRLCDLSNWLHTIRRMKYL
jgi:hypothetical protein